MLCIRTVSATVSFHKCNFCVTKVSHRWGVVKRFFLDSSKNNAKRAAEIFSKTFQQCNSSITNKMHSVRVWAFVLFLPQHSNFYGLFFVLLRFCAALLMNIYASRCSFCRSMTYRCRCRFPKIKTRKACRAMVRAAGMWGGTMQSEHAFVKPHPPPRREELAFIRSCVPAPVLPQGVPPRFSLFFTGKTLTLSLQCASILKDFERQRCAESFQSNLLRTAQRG